MYTSTLTEKWPSWATLSDVSSAGPFMQAGSSHIYAASGTRMQKFDDQGPVLGCVPVWSYDATVAIASMAVEYDGVVYFGRNSGHYCAIRASNKTVLGRWPYCAAAGNGSGGVMVDLINGRVLFGSSGGDLHAFAKETP